MYLNRGWPRVSAAALAVARENGKNGVGTQLGLGFSAVEFDHGFIHRYLIGGVHALKSGQNFFLSRS